MSCIVMIYKELFLTIPKFLDLSLGLNFFLMLSQIERVVQHFWTSFNKCIFETSTYLANQQMHFDNLCFIIY
jgi:hypothetical protein